MSIHTAALVAAFLLIFSAANVTKHPNDGHETLNHHHGNEVPKEHGALNEELQDIWSGICQRNSISHDKSCTRGGVTKNGLPQILWMRRQYTVNEAPEQELKLTADSNFRKKSKPANTASRAPKMQFIFVKTLTADREAAAINRIISSGSSEKMTKKKVTTVKSISPSQEIKRTPTLEVEVTSKNIYSEASGKTDRKEAVTTTRISPFRTNEKKTKKNAVTTRRSIPPEVSEKVTKKEAATTSSGLTSVATRKEDAATTKTVNSEATERTTRKKAPTNNIFSSGSNEAPNTAKDATLRKNIPRRRDRMMTMEAVTTSKIILSEASKTSSRQEAPSDVISSENGDMLMRTKASRNVIVSSGSSERPKRTKAPATSKIILFDVNKRTTKNEAETTSSNTFPMTRERMTKKKATETSDSTSAEASEMIPSKEATTTTPIVSSEISEKTKREDATTTIKITSKANEINAGKETAASSKIRPPETRENTTRKEAVTTNAIVSTASDEGTTRKEAAATNKIIPSETSENTARKEGTTIEEIAPETRIRTTRLGPTTTNNIISSEMAETATAEEATVTRKIISTKDMARTSTEQVTCVPPPAACVFPFKYRGHAYSMCTKPTRNRKSWCATAVDKTGHFIGLYMECVNVCQSHIYKTHCNPPPEVCVFPFKYKGRTYARCTASTRKRKSWCATAVDQRGYFVGKMAYCGNVCADSDTEAPCKPPPKECVFPFKYKNRTFTTCTKGTIWHKSWCATAVNNDGNFIGLLTNCDNVCEKGGNEGKLTPVQ